MITSEFLVSVAAFILGCILTEVRWIFRMRRLQGQLNFGETSLANESQRMPVFASGDTSFESSAAYGDTGESLRNLGHELAKNAPVRPAPHSLTVLKS